jgi:hypothetical protein
MLRGIEKSRTFCTPVRRVLGAGRGKEVERES